MKPSDDYPRMLFHRTKDPVTVHSREEEEGLGAEWSRKIWPPVEEVREKNSEFPEDFGEYARWRATGQAAAAEYQPQPDPEPDDEEDDDEEEIEDSHPAPPPDHPPARKSSKRPAKPSKKKR